MKTHVVIIGLCKTIIAVQLTALRESEKIGGIVRRSGHIYRVKHSAKLCTRMRHKLIGLL
jgi:hypothetical protein